LPGCVPLGLPAYEHARQSHTPAGRLLARQLWRDHIVRTQPAAMSLQRGHSAEPNASGERGSRGRAAGLSASCRRMLAAAMQAAPPALQRRTWSVACRRVPAPCAAPEDRTSPQRNLMCCRQPAGQHCHASKAPPLLPRDQAGSWCNLGKGTLTPKTWDLASRRGGRVAIGPDLACACRRDVRAARLARARDAGEDAQRAAALGRGRAWRLQHAQARAGSARRHERGELAGARVERVVPQQHARFLLHRSERAVTALRLQPLVALACR